MLHDSYISHSIFIKQLAVVYKGELVACCQDGRLPDAQVARARDEDWSNGRVGSVVQRQGECRC